MLAKAVFRTWRVRVGASYERMRVGKLISVLRARACVHALMVWVCLFICLFFYLFVCLFRLYICLFIDVFLLLVYCLSILLVCWWFVGSLVCFFIKFSFCIYVFPNFNGNGPFGVRLRMEFIQLTRGIAVFCLKLLEVLTNGMCAQIMS